MTVGAETILTLNLKNFPTGQLPNELSATAPDEFLSRLFDHNPTALLQTMTDHRASLTRPPKTAEKYVESLRKGGLTELARRVSARLDQI